MQARDPRNTFLTSGIHFCDKWCRLINDLDVNVFNFKRFGKELPKQHKLSPHSFIQVALQLAYYRSVMSYALLANDTYPSKCT